MSEYLYFPLVKTRDAELRCMENLPKEVLDKVLPIYELTKSRTTKKAPDGDIHRRMKKVAEIQDGRPFILDLNTSEKYINTQIKQLISEYDGFYEWQYFLEIYSSENIIPMIHLYEDTENNFADVRKFVSDMSKKYTALALRIPHDLEQKDLAVYIDPIKESLHPDAKIIFIIDADFIRSAYRSNKDNLIANFCSTIDFLNRYQGIIEDTVTMFSSFPSSAAQAGKDENEGEFSIDEELLYKDILNTGRSIKYGDYASINTEQLDIRGGTFIPRIDIALDEEFIYKRYKTDKGSYPKCAERMLDDDRYVSLNTWADQEIQLASKNEPTGRSPSFWISVRMCYYITSRLRLRQKV